MVETTQDQEQAILDKAVAEGGAYEVINKRLQDQGRQLEDKINRLNDARLTEFGKSDMAIIGRARIRTDNNCVARDIVRVGDYLLFGYNVFLGLQKETKVADVFGLYSLRASDQGLEIDPVSLNASFLSDTRFLSDFNELYTYFKDVRLVQLLVQDGMLLAAFQMGERLNDLRVFRWSVSVDGQEVRYIDNRGERDVAPPPAFDFEWKVAGRDQIVEGRHPHLNILDTLFVDTVAGDLTVKIENNTKTGKGIYAEPVDDHNQSLDDAEFHYADLGSLILLKIRPYREKEWRHLIFNRQTRQVTRLDAIGDSCIRLPEEHGLIFPGGYYLQNGEHKAFEDTPGGLHFRRMLRSPNGEDVLFVFYEPVEGLVALYAYNLINKSLQNPLYGHGYALFEDGCMVIFHAETEATRIHPMQLWQTPYISDEYASRTPPRQSFYGRIGNAELVRGISDLYSIRRLIGQKQVSVAHYDLLAKQTLKLFDAYHWLGKDELDGIERLLRDIAATSELVLDEYEKVEAIRQQAAQALQQAELTQTELLRGIAPDRWQQPQEFVDALAALRRQRGHLLTIRDYRYINTARIAELDQVLEHTQNQLSAQTAHFLSGPQALVPYQKQLDELQRQLDAVARIVELQPVLDALTQMGEGLDLLSELVASLKVDDATQRTAIIDAISEIYARLNQTKANAQHKRRSLGSAEAVAQFAAQFKLFSQSIANALGMATTPERCDEQLTRLLTQLEELESQFSEHDEFLADIISKREEIYESFEAHKQKLLDERQRRAQTLGDAAGRILKGLGRRVQKFVQADELNAFFAADPLILKLRELSEQLRELGDSLRADDVEARLKSSKDQALRSLRDKSDIYEEDGRVIKLGPRHRFSVSTQELDLTILPRNDGLALHLTGTDFFEMIEDAELNALKPYWQLSLESESEQVYRGEWLAYAILQAALHNRDELRFDDLKAASADLQNLLPLVRNYAAPRYREGYEKGIHDQDAALILAKLVPLYDSAGSLRFDAGARALAVYFWEQLQRQDLTGLWPERAKSALRQRDLFGSQRGCEVLERELAQHLEGFRQNLSLDVDDATLRRAASYLVEELGQLRVEFPISRYAQQLHDRFKQELEQRGAWRDLREILDKLQDHPGERWQQAHSWLHAYAHQHHLQWVAFVAEAASLLLADARVSRRHTEVDLQTRIEGLMGHHARIQERNLDLRLDDFLLRLQYQAQVVQPGYQRYQQVRQQIADRERKRLRLNEFKPRPLSSFVRNKLINEAYLPLIGDNLAKQMGTVGDSKRTDLMGMLMLISPPGYGKTTLMEYVANRLGLIFMKINCPSLGHDVTNLDPSTAGDSAARQELEKINLAFEMGNNVMLYLDDIQHTNPEFLQKFISLCDGTRRVEGVWKGQSRTYDMRGKRFCIVMSGNPYTESGEVFKIPDMLANRADIYNLGEVLGGLQDVFALSYIENGLTSNAALAPLATRDMADVYRFVDLARGGNVASTEFSHDYSAAERNEVVEVLKRLTRVQEVVLRVNQQYIASSAQDDRYRNEPPFKLQGSYRNMNKMTEKVSAIMTEQELLQLIDDHYQGEAQLLTKGTEENLLKLAELRGNMTEAQQARWQEIKTEFQRNRAAGGSDLDTGSKVVRQLNLLTEQMTAIRGALVEAMADKPQPDSGGGETLAAIRDSLQSLDALKSLAPEALQSLATRVTETLATQLSGGLAPKVEVTTPAHPDMADALRQIATTFQDGILPLVRLMDGKLNIDLRTHERMGQVLEEVKKLQPADKASAKKSDATRTGKQAGLFGDEDPGA